MTFFSKNTSTVVKRLGCYIALKIGLPHRLLLPDCASNGRGWSKNTQKYDHVVYECPLSCLLMIILLISRFENFGPQMTFFGFTFSSQGNS